MHNVMSYEVVRALAHDRCDRFIRQADADRLAREARSSRELQWRRPLFAQLSGRRRLARRPAQIGA